MTEPKPGDRSLSSAEEAERLDQIADMLYKPQPPLDGEPLLEGISTEEGLLLRLNRMEAHTRRLEKKLEALTEVVLTYTQISSDNLKRFDS